MNALFCIYLLLFNVYIMETLSSPEGHSTQKDQYKYMTPDEKGPAVWLKKGEYGWEMSHSQITIFKKNV